MQSLGSNSHSYMSKVGYVKEWPYVHRCQLLHLLLTSAVSASIQHILLIRHLWADSEPPTGHVNLFLEVFLVPLFGCWLLKLPIQ